MAALEGAADREIERGGVEVGEAGEMLEERPARDAGDGGDGGGGRFDVAGLDQVESRLDQRLPGPKTPDDAAVLRPRYVNRKTDNFHIKTNKIGASLMDLH